MARGTKVWLNGKILPEENARISLFTHGLHYGTGAFEGIRAYKQKSGGAIFRLREHLDRLYESAKILDLKIPYSLDELTRACVETCKANGFDECYLRPIIYIADGPLGVFPGPTPPVDVAVLVWEWGSYLGDKGVNEGAKLKVSSFIRPHVNSSMTKGKITGQYVNPVMAKREAVALGYDEALLLDSDGFLTEGSGMNLFMVKDGVVKTTPLTSILNGITRQTVIEYFKKSGTPLVETRFTRDELWCADEVFLTGTAAEITPVREIDGRMVGKTGKPGAITAKLQKDYKAMVRGELAEFARWLTPIAEPRMLIGVGRIVLDFYGNDNAALKHRQLEDLCDDLRRKFNVSALEVADFDDPERCVMGFAAVIPENWKDASAESLVEKICETIDKTAFARVTVEDWDLLSHGEG